MSNVTNNVVSNVVSCSICSDTHKDDTINLTCGHAFGRSCIKSWMKDSGKTNCFLCPKELTTDEINRIIDRSLSERMVVISKKAFSVFSQSFCIIFFFTQVIAVDSYISTMEGRHYETRESLDVYLKSPAFTYFFDRVQYATIGAAATSLVAGVREGRFLGAATNVRGSFWANLGTSAGAVAGLAAGMKRGIANSGSGLLGFSDVLGGFASGMLGAIAAHAFDGLETLYSTTNRANSTNRTVSSPENSESTT